MRHVSSHSGRECELLTNLVGEVVLAALVVLDLAIDCHAGASKVVYIVEPEGIGK